MTVLYVMAAIYGAGSLFFLVDSVSVCARNIGRIADEMKASREEQKRQFDLERQYPRAP